MASKDNYISASDGASIKTYREGNNLVIVVENCTKELEVMACVLLADLHGVFKKPLPVNGLKRVDIPESSAPDINKLEPVSLSSIPDRESVLPEGSFRNLTVRQILGKYGSKAAAQIIAGNYSSDWKQECKDYMFVKAAALGTNPPDRQGFIEFCKDYDAVLGNIIRENILQKAGYGTVQHMAAKASDKQMYDAILYLRVQAARICK